MTPSLVALCLLAGWTILLVAGVALYRLAATAAGRGAVTDPLAMPLFYARLGQSTVHLISTSVPMVLLRATLFVVQLAIAASWIYRLVA